MGLKTQDLSIVFLGIACLLLSSGSDLVANPGNGEPIPEEEEVRAGGDGSAILRTDNRRSWAWGTVEEYRVDLPGMTVSYDDMRICSVTFKEPRGDASDNYRVYAKSEFGSGYGDEASFLVNPQATLMLCDALAYAYRALLPVRIGYTPSKGIEVVELWNSQAYDLTQLAAGGVSIPPFNLEQITASTFTLQSDQSTNFIAHVDAVPLRLYVHALGCSGDLGIAGPDVQGGPFMGAAFEIRYDSYLGFDDADTFWRQANSLRSACNGLFAGMNSLQQVNVVGDWPSIASDRFGKIRSVSRLSDREAWDPLVLTNLNDYTNATNVDLLKYGYSSYESPDGSNDSLLNRIPAHALRVSADPRDETAACEAWLKLSDGKLVRARVLYEMIDRPQYLRGRKASAMCNIMISHLQDMAVNTQPLKLRAVVQTEELGRVASAHAATEEQRTPRLDLLNVELETLLHGAASEYTSSTDPMAYVSCADSVCTASNDTPVQLRMGRNEGPDLSVCEGVLQLHNDGQAGLSGMNQPFDVLVSATMDSTDHRADPEAALLSNMHLTGMHNAHYAACQGLMLTTGDAGSTTMQYSMPTSAHPAKITPKTLELKKP